MPPTTAIETPSPPMLGHRRALALGFVFVVSGAASLVYQIVWIRLLSLTLGSTVYAIALVVGAFMGGLALGSALLGRLADRRGSTLTLYALLELGIAAAALAMPFAFDAIAAGAAGADTALGKLLNSKIAPFFTSFIVLLVPTTLMGGTLPVMSRFVSGFDTSRGSAIGGLYAVNTAGAILGTALTGFVLIRSLGIDASTYAAAAANVLVALAALAGARAWPHPAPRAVGREAPERVAGENRRELLAPVTVVYLVNGFVGLGLELLWTRAIVLFTINTIYAFTVILTTFLFGLAAGSSFMSARLHRVERAPALLGLFQVGIGLIAALTPFALNRSGLAIAGWADALGGDSSLLGPIAGAYVVAGLFMLPPTLLMGASFPLVARVVASATSRVGEAVGRVYALNTLGAVAGSLAAAFVLLPLLGIQRSIVFLGLASAASGAFLLSRAGSRRGAALALATCAALGVAFVAMPGQLRPMLERSLGHELLFYEEGIETTVGVYESERAARPVLVLNNTALDDRGVVHKLLAHLPLLVHPEPRRALVLGFGVGISSESISSHEIAVNHCVEISPAVMRAAPSFASLNGNIAGRGDPGYSTFIEDGRRLLLSRGDPYDLIVLDANSGNLRNAGVGKLYTREFFELCRDRLTRDGIVTVYASPNGTLREFNVVVRTFTEVFPETTMWIDRVFGETTVLMGARAPLRLDLDRFLARMSRPSVRADLVSFDLDQPEALLSCFLMGSALTRLFAEGSPLNTDDRPIMEFHPLSMPPFDLADRPFSEAGFALSAESIVPYLEVGSHPDTERVLAALASAERSFPSMDTFWQLRRGGSRDAARTALARAAALESGAEHLRSSLGYGRADARSAYARAAAGADPRALLQAAWIALERGELERAGTLFDTTLSGRPDSIGAPGAAYVGAARVARARGALEGARSHLDRAAAAGVDVALERLELRAGGAIAVARVRQLQALQRDGNRATGTKLLVALLEKAPGVVGARREARALELAGALTGTGGDGSPALPALGRDRLLALALALEDAGDPAGAYLVFRAVEAAGDDLTGAAAEGRRRSEIVLGLRHAVRARATLPGEQANAVLRSRFLPASVGVDALPHLDPRDGAPWLALVELNARAGRTHSAYRYARAARTVAPEAGAPYLWIGRFAAAAGQIDVARSAFVSARERGVDAIAIGRELEALERREVSP